MTVAYYRVSTDKQGQSGLGLEAQRESVTRFLGCDPSTEFVEVESGRKADRPQLAAALDLCKREKRTLVVAKLDRLARDVSMILRIVDSGVPVRFIDLPDVDATTATGRLILSVMGSLAEFEARRISERTRDALAAKKARGHKLGSGNPRAGAAVISDRARAYAQSIEHLISETADMNTRQAAAFLTRSQVPAPNGGHIWHPSTVQRVRARLC